MEPERVVPMIHVPDVRATVDWYQGIGFKVNYTFDNGEPGAIATGSKNQGAQRLFNGTLLDDHLVDPLS